MAGRGRPATSLTQEQLMALGVNSKEMQSVTNAPPPIFPPLFSKPSPLEVSQTRLKFCATFRKKIRNKTFQTRNARDYKILWKEDFVSYLKDSPYYINPSTDNEKKIQRYSDKYIVSPLEAFYLHFSLKTQNDCNAASLHENKRSEEQRLCMGPNAAGVAAELEAKEGGWQRKEEN